MLILPLKAHPLYQASWDMKGFPGSPPLVPGSSFLELFPPLSPRDITRDHPICQNYKNFEPPKGEDPRLYSSLPRKLPVSYAKYPLSPQQISSVYWDSWEGLAFSCYKEYSVTLFLQSKGYLLSCIWTKWRDLSRWFFSKDLLQGDDLSFLSGKQALATCEPDSFSW